MRCSVFPPIIPIAGSILFILGNLNAAIPASSQRIDAILKADWTERSIAPGELVSDERFVRRVYLDVIGRIPTAEEIRTFQNDASETRRAALIDHLLVSEGYVNHMFTFWADLLRISSTSATGRDGIYSYVAWVKDALRTNMPYDEFVRRLVSDEGGIYENGAVGYYVRDRGMPLENLANTTRIFLGTRLECAQCHDHPFDTWTQRDFYSMAAFSYGMTADRERRSDTVSEAAALIKADESKDNAEKRQLTNALNLIRAKIKNNVRVGHDAEVLLKLPHDYAYDDARPGDPVKPATMFGSPLEIESPGEKVTRYAEWMTSPENPRFTKTIVNRLWKEIMGESLYDSVDNFTNASNSAHPELVDFLEKEMIQSGYDVKAFLRTILNSNVYRRASYSDEIDAENPHVFTGPLMRRLSAEQTWDSIVALINPRPETGNWKKDEEYFLRTYWPEMLSESIRSLSPNELTKMAAKVVEVQEKHAAKMAAAKDRKKAADKVRDKKASLAASGDIKALQYSLPDEIYLAVFGPQIVKAGLGRKGDSIPERIADYAKAADPTQVAYDGKSRVVILRELAAAETAYYENEMNELGIDDLSVRRSYPSYRKPVTTTYIRAAHLSTPAPAGHFLRQLGQSDRETIENAESVPSIPQTLTLLNGPVLERICHPLSVLSRDRENTEDDAERIDSVYLSLLGRSPTETERGIILTNAQERPELWQEDLIFALLNSREFSYQQ